MKKLLLSLCVVFSSFTLFAVEGGTLSVNPEGAIDPNTTVTITYDGTTTNFGTWDPKCFIHTWLVAKADETFSKSYTTQWHEDGQGLGNPNGNEWYDQLDSKVKMTYIGPPQGMYSIDINIKDFFDVADEDLDKIASIGFIVRAQWSGDNNRTGNMFLDVEVPPLPLIDKFSFNWGVEGQSGWQSIEFSDSGDGNMFTADWTLPEDNATLSFYVGYNNGTGDPTFIDGKSNTTLISNIRDFANVQPGEVTLTIYKDSGDNNWWIGVSQTPTSINEATKDSFTYFSVNNSLKMSFDGTANVEVYTAAGKLVGKRNVINETVFNNLVNGLYLVKVNNQVTKVLVK